MKSVFVALILSLLLAPFFYSEAAKCLNAGRWVDCGNNLPKLPGVDDIRREINNCLSGGCDPVNVINNFDGSSEAWGEMGRVLYPAAAETMEFRHGGSTEHLLTPKQKRYLRQSFGDLVDRVVVTYNARLIDYIGSFDGKSLKGESAAQTYGHKIYVSSALNPDDLDQIGVIAHELVHSFQYEKYDSSLKNFGYHYFKSWAMNGFQYDQISLEKEAFQKEKDFLAIISSQQQSRYESGYFADGGATLYADGEKFCGFLTPAHYQMHRFGKDNVPRLGNRSRIDFGSDGGICETPSGYFAYDNATHYSMGNGQYCSFFTADAYKSHGSRRSQEPRFGVLESDPKVFMTWVGGCSE